MGKTLVIFDVDGTLVFSNRVDSQCFAQIYETIYGKPFPSIDWRKYPHVTDHTIFNSVIEEHFGRSATQDEIGHFQDHFVSLLEKKRVENPEEFQQVPRARETILALMADPEYVVGIGTGGWKRPAHLKLSHVQIPANQLFVSAADGKVTREAILEEVIADAVSHHAVFKKIVYVGDAVWDVQTTRNLSLDFVGIRRNGDLHVLHEAGATCVLQDFSDHQLFIQAIQDAVPPGPP